AISPSGPTIDSGQSITLTSHASGGTPPLLYQWYSDSSCQAPLPGTTSSTYTAFPTTTTSYSYKVTDSAYSSEALCSGGDLVTVSPTLFAGDITPSTPLINSGQSITLSTNPSGGTTPYHYQWFSGASPSCSSDTTLLGTTQIQSVSPAANTYYCYSVTDSAFAPSTQSSATDLVTTNTILTAGPITPSTPAIDNGQTITLSANPSGGTTPYHYQWYSEATFTSAIPTTSSPTYSASPDINTTYSYTVTDSAYSPVSRCSSGDTVTVNPALAAQTITPSGQTIDSGQSITLTTHTTGRTGSLSYQ